MICEETFSSDTYKTDRPRVPLVDARDITKTFFEDKTFRLIQDALLWVSQELRGIAIPAASCVVDWISAVWTYIQSNTGTRYINTFLD